MTAYNVKECSTTASMVLCRTNKHYQKLVHAVGAGTGTNKKLEPYHPNAPRNRPKETVRACRYNMQLHMQLSPCDTNCNADHTKQLHVAKLDCPHQCGHIIACIVDRVTIDPDVLVKSCIANMQAHAGQSCIPICHCRWRMWWAPGTSCTLASNTKSTAAAAKSSFAMGILTQAAPGRPPIRSAASCVKTCVIIGDC